MVRCFFVATLGHGVVRCFTEATLGYSLGPGVAFISLTVVVVRCFIDATLRHSLGPGAPREVGQGPFLPTTISTQSIRRGAQVGLPVVRASPGVSQLTIPPSKV